MQSQPTLPGTRFITTMSAVTSRIEASRQINSRPLAVRNRPALEAMFAPKSVALIGATDRAGSVGRALLQNLRHFPGRFYPITPTHQTVLDIPARKSIADIPEKLDLAVIATRAATIPGIVRECAEAGVRGAIIISGGFREVGDRGRELEKEIAAECGTMRIIGPNCVGLMLPHIGLNASRNLSRSQAISVSSAKAARFAPRFLIGA
jgi:acetyltransferase